MLNVKPILTTLTIVALSLSLMNCSQRSSFSAKKPAASNANLVDVNGQPQGQPFVDNNTTAIDANGNPIYVSPDGTYFVIVNGVGIVTDKNGVPIDDNSNNNNGNTNPPIGIITVEGRYSPGVPADTAIANPTSPGVTCGQWVSVSDVYKVHVPGIIAVAIGLQPMPGIRPEIHAGDESLDEVCRLMGCGQALAAYTRDYHSPHDNTIVRFENGKWLKEGAKWSNSTSNVRRNNLKIGNKYGTKGLRCDLPGVYTSGNASLHHTD